MCGCRKPVVQDSTVVIEQSSVPTPAPAPQPEPQPVGASR